MKRTNTLKAAVLGVSLLTLSGIAGSLHASTLVVEPEAMAEVKHDQKAIDVIEKSFDAVGGRELMESAEYVYFKGGISIPAAGITGSIETFIHAPDKLLVLVNIPMIGEQKQGVNGDVAWSSDAMSGPRLLPEDEAKALREETNPASRLNYKKDNPVIEYAGEVDFDGQKAHKIRLVDEDNKESHEYYSVEKGYLIGNEAKVPTPMGELQMTSYMREYKEMAGVMQPTKMVQKAGPQEFVITITDVSYGEIDASKFELPAAVQALVKAQKKED
jgi:hypothetical protein